MSKVFDVTEYKSPGKVNTRQGVARGQNWRVRFREGRFFISNDVFEENEMENTAFAVKIHPVSNQVLLIETENDNADLFKRSSRTGEQKPKDFKSSVIENALHAAGLINKDLPKENQYLDFEYGETSDGAKVMAFTTGTGTVREVGKKATGAVVSKGDAVAAGSGEVPQGEDTDAVLDPSEGLGQAPSSEDLVLDSSELGFSDDDFGKED
jgi:hypothetical protein